MRFGVMLCCCSRECELGPDLAKQNQIKTEKSSETKFSVIFNYDFVHESLSFGEKIMLSEFSMRLAFTIVCEFDSHSSL